MDNLPDIIGSLKEIDLDVADVFNIFVYGSRIYGTHTGESDWDILVVLNDDSSFILNEGINNYFTIGILDITVLKLENVKNELRQHNMQRIELLWPPLQNVLPLQNDLLQFFVLDRKMLRVAVSTISNKCMGYAKILWLKENDIKKSKKNVFHSIRYVLFGAQIALTGKITNYEAANDYLYQMQKCTLLDWFQFHEIYGKKAKELHKYFLSVVEQ